MQFRQEFAVGGIRRIINVLKCKNIELKFYGVFFVLLLPVKSEETPGQSQASNFPLFPVFMLS